MGVLPGFATGNKFLAVKIFPAAKISGGPVWNLARIRDENVININQTTNADKTMSYIAVPSIVDMIVISLARVS